MVEQELELKKVVRELPIACAVCSVLRNKDYCGLALYYTYYLNDMGAKRIPSGCVNGLGGLNAKEIEAKFS